MKVCGERSRIVFDIFIDQSSSRDTLKMLAAA